MTISSAGAGIANYITIQYTSQYICHDSVMMHHYIIIGSQLKLRQKRDKNLSMMASECESAVSVSISSLLSNIVPLTKKHQF